ncbi:MAG: class I SAM-dependent methyltransferase [Planctomycetia bacterium]|nr:class I SAM-dependent methyltransferase [Planctomycetia bacterium]
MAPEAATVSGNRTRFDPRRCVVLVPYLDAIHPECEAALHELERRGYTVRRVGGYSQIDVARNQMASDALRDGFEETLWIDSDIVFQADSVERLRMHPHGVVGGLYARKGTPGFACQLLPGTPSLSFGDKGGLVEVEYLATGFLLVRRPVYLAVQKKFQLPVCNERFGPPLTPFFLPLVRPVEGGHWYLGEDYAFCHRVRECGYRIYADTTFRLWHIGRQRYTWEDAATPRVESSSYNFTIVESGKAEGNAGAPVAFTKCPQVAAFAERHPWPNEKPVVPPFPDRNWLFPATEGLLRNTVPQTSKLIVELGSWTGRSTRFLAELAPSATIVAVDHWEGSPEHRTDPELRDALPRLYETFLAECWAERERIIPVRSSSVAGLRAVAQAGLVPDAVYIDADHRFESVVADLTAALDLFPSAVIVGDDWDWEEVRKAVEAVLAPRGLRCDVLGTAWRVVR